MVFITEFSTFNGFEEVLLEIAKLIHLSKPEAPVTEVKQGVITHLQVLKQTHELKPQSKNFKIISCVVLSEDPNQSTAPKSLTTWILKTDDKLLITIKYLPTSSGRLEEFIMFGVRGIRDPYSVKCIATIIHPSFNINPTQVFARQRKNKEIDDVVAGEYIVDTNTYEFGYLVAGKPKDSKAADRHKTNFNFPNETENPIKVTVSLRNDAKNDVFSLDSSSFTINPGKIHTLNMWAFPKTVNNFDDMIVCCILDNPEPIFINVSCIGTKLELEFDKKQMNFDKISIGVLEKREVTVKNQTTIPLTWKINMTELNTDELTLSPTEGIVAPHEKFTILGKYNLHSILTQNR